MNVNLTLTKDYRKNDCLAPQKTNPTQTQFLQKPKSLAKKSGQTHNHEVTEFVFQEAMNLDTMAVVHFAISPGK